MERLTKRNKNGEVSKVKSSRATYVCTILEEEAKFNQEVLDRLAEYEDAEEVGLIKRLPCKEGDTVYLPWEYDGESDIAELTVKHVSVDEEDIDTNLESDNYDFLWKYDFGVFGFEEIGKRVFLTEAEAQVKLKEMQKIANKFPKLEPNDIIEVHGNEELRFFCNDECEQFDGIVHPDEDNEFKEEDITKVWRPQVHGDGFVCIYKRTKELKG